MDGFLRLQLRRLTILRRGAILTLNLNGMRLHSRPQAERAEMTATQQKDLD